MSNMGRVRSLERYVQFGNKKRKVHEKILSICKMQRKRGVPYYCVELSKDGKPKTAKLHRVVAEAFIPNPLNKSCVNHIDYDTSNNKVENLEWCTHKENNKHSYLRMKNSLKGVNSGIKLNNKNENHHIYYRARDKNYRVCFVNKGIRYEKCFKHFDKAIDWRDKKIQEIMRGETDAI